MIKDIEVSVGNKIFILFFVVVVFTTGVVAWFGFKSAKDSYINSALFISESETTALANNINGILGTVPEDVIYNANFYALYEYFIWRELNEKRKARDWKSLYITTLKEYLLNKKLYYQVRLLDDKGKELILLKYDEKTNKVIVVEEHEFQDKSKREYFKKAIKLQKGDFYISHMNLNIENGQIEKPYVSVVRYSTPIIDLNGEIKGVIVLNLNANSILKQIKNASLEKDDQKEYFLLNKDGGYLYHKDPSKRWGFQLGNDFSFQKDFKGIIEEFEGKEKTVFLKDDNIFSMYKIYPNKVDNKYRYWYLVTKIDKDLALSSLEHFIIIFIGVLIGVITFGFLFIRNNISRLINPLSKVTNQLIALSKGEIKKENIAYTSSDEISKIVDSTKILVDAIETTINQANAVASGDFSKDINLLSKNDNLGLALKDMTARLKEITNLANTIALGNYDVQIVAKSSEDKLGLALLKMVKYLENITQIAESIAVGNLDVKYKTKGENDRLGNVILQMIYYLNAILDQANAITENNFNNNIEIKSKNDELGIALSKMTNILRNNAKKNKDEIWFSDGINILSAALSGIDETLELSKKAIVTMCKYINAVSGVIYLYNKGRSELTLEASYSYNDKGLSRSFNLGEGVVGQVAIEKEPILLNNIEDEDFNIKSATLNTKPKEVFVFPLSHEDDLLGVVEIMSFNSFNKIYKDYLLKSSNIITIALHTTAQNMKIKQLFEDSQKAYGELQIKSKEIKKAKLEIDKRANELELSNKYKSEFLANMSHELRTPLNSIILLSSLLSQNKKENLDVDDIKKINVINESGNELLRLINDILDLSKIESGKMELIVDKIDTKELVNKYNNTFIDSAKEKNIEFKIIDDIKGFFYNDEDRLGQILRNLISNSLKFTKEGSISLKFEHSKNENFPIKISVSDTGIGIEKEKQTLIFEAFTQADGSTSRKYGGTGLGLSISKELTSLMGGEISFQSVKEEGTTFTLLLPDLTGEYNSLSKANTDFIQKEELVDDNIFEQFLIIEDDRSFSNVLEEILKEHGISTFTAHSGKEALEIIQKHKIDVAIVDINLPDMTGIDVIKEIKNNTLSKNTHIQIISICDESENVLDDLGIDGYLQKPVSNKEIENVISNLEYISKKDQKNILIVEDDASHRNIVKEYINEEGLYDIKTASGVAEAKALIEKVYFDLAIIDLGLDDGDGAEICKLIKDTKSDTKVLVYTSRDLSIDDKNSLNNISDKIIMKNPNSYKKLKSEIKSFLSKRNIPKNKKVEQDVPKVIKKKEVQGLANKKVLIVDDNIKNIFVLDTLLQEYSMKVEYTKNGKEAIEFLKENSDIDIVIMDIMMPIMNGYEAIKAIRKDESLKHLPIIAVSAKAMKKDKEEAMKSGANDYLTKPIDMYKLIDILSFWIKK